MSQVPQRPNALSVDPMTLFNDPFSPKSAALRDTMVLLGGLVQPQALPPRPQYNSLQPILGGLDMSATK